MTTKQPSLETFLQLSNPEITSITPQTIVAAFGGTRRSAALEGLDPRSKEAMLWQRDQMLDCYSLIFSQGVQNIITSLSINHHLLEADLTRQQVLSTLSWGMAGKDILNEYQQRGWRVRLIGIEHLPELAQAASTLELETANKGAPTVWFWVCSDFDQPITAIFDTIHRTGITNQAELVEVMYGELIPPAQLLIGFGEPTFHYGLLPPLLMQRLECYWVQRPGYKLDLQTLRRILYDFAYTRQTGSGEERNDRYHNIQEHRNFWLTDWVLGTGTQVGGFWYPTSFSGVRK
jgi:hypothetical protein